jgi:hypothetical protein
LADRDGKSVCQPAIDRSRDFTLAARARLNLTRHDKA